ncbi:MAG: hypothetical protein LW848_03545, partial [Hyphomonadaceae bacterium]|nr:hypothetical protein [Hyphomonadaceae bacterium]
MKRPLGPTSAIARETLRRGMGRVREAAPLLRKGRLAGLGLLGVLIGFIQSVIELAMREAYEALDRRHEAQIKKGSDTMGRRREWRDEDDEEDQLDDYTAIEGLESHQDISELVWMDA